VQAEENTAGFSRPGKNAFRHPERAHLELIVLTKNFVDIFSQVFQVLQSDHTGQHWNFGLLFRRHERWMKIAPCGLDKDCQLPTD
jgi:hypothetical protein